MGKKIKITEEVSMAIDVLKTSVKFLVAEEAPVIHSLARDIMGEEHLAELDLLDVYDKLHLIITNMEYYYTTRMPMIWENMENNSKTVNLTFKEKVDDEIILKSKRDAFKKIVAETYRKLLSICTTFNAIKWLLLQNIHVNLASDFTIYSENLFEGKTVEDKLVEFYEKSDVFNNLETFKDVNSLKLTALCQDLAEENVLEKILIDLANETLKYSDGPEAKAVNAFRIIASIISHPLVYFIGQSFRYEKLANLALKTEELNWHEIAINNILPTTLKDVSVTEHEKYKFCHSVYRIASLLLTQKEEFENLLDFFLDENNAIHKHDGKFTIPYKFDVREKILAGNYDTIDKVYESILKGLKILGYDISDVPAKFSELPNIDNLKNGDGDNFKPFVLVSAILTLIYSLKIFVQNSSYTEHINAMDNMVSFVSGLEENLEKLREVMKEKLDTDPEKVN